MLKIITYFVPILFIILFTPLAQAEGTTPTNINIIPLNSSDIPNIIKERHERFGALCIAEIKEEDKLLALAFNGRQILFSSTIGQLSASIVGRKYENGIESEFFHDISETIFLDGYINAENPNKPCPEKQNCGSYPAKLTLEIGSYHNKNELSKSVNVTEICEKDAINNIHNFLFYKPSILERILGGYRH